MILAPIVLFVYSRLEHTRQVIEALQNNILAKDSELIIYSDFAKTKELEDKVKGVREYIKCINGFKNVTIIYRDKNLGLANSIIDGVTTVVNRYGKVIVLEDDIVTNRYFLKFMNEALEFYKDKKKVWHIAGWNYPISSEGLDDTFLWRLMNCWGWATWSDRWDYFEKDSDKLIKEFTKEQIKYMNLDGCLKTWSQVISNKKGLIDTWAVYWYACIIKNNGLCLNPVKTLVINIGIDGSGENCGRNDAYESALSDKETLFFSIDLYENTIALQRIIQFYNTQKKITIKRIINKIKRVFGK